MDKIGIAVVDDSAADAGRVEELCRGYFEAKGVPFECSLFESGIAFLQSRESYELVFLDVEMPDLDGIKTAEHLRKKDGCAEIVFVTSFAQFALNGYKVAALDYIVKPCDGTSFDMTMDEFMRRRNGRRRGSVTLRSHSVTVRVPIDSVYYVESRGHWLVWHTDSGDVETWGNMANAEGMLGEGFARCNVSMLIALGKVTELAGNTVMVGGSCLPISRSRKKTFAEALMRSAAGVT